MARPIELAGKSGARYRYMPLEEERFLPPAGANFVIAELSGGGARLVYAGETDNLANQTWRSALERARQSHPKAKILTRLNVTRAIREAERMDLIEQHQPPLNQASS
ncbi:MAG: SGNH/GDSL hydrolase family protein [Phenylobacterium sp.]|nr:MAG: SGNH/GDSL hydrolase family protein [Phenylobacterium sp.]